MIFIDDLTQMFDFQGGDPMTPRQHTLISILIQFVN